jgi:hypothetical protein
VSLPYGGLDLVRGETADKVSVAPGGWVVLRESVR